MNPQLTNTATTLTFNLSSSPALHITEPGGTCRILADRVDVAVSVNDIDGESVLVALTVHGQVSRPADGTVALRAAGSVIVPPGNDIPDWLDALVDRAHAAAEGLDMLLRAGQAR